MEHEILSETELSPEKIVAAIPKMQKKGLSGDKPYTDPARWEEATEHPTQYALSLSGEPTLYSKLPELIDLLREDPKNSVFVVSNGTMPSVIERIRPTQLYLSLDAVDVSSYEKICRPIGDPAAMWGNIQTSLSLLRQKEEEGIRTAVRITLVNGYNDTDEEGFAKIIEEAQPLFVEVKGYMYLGYSRMRLTEMHVPDMETIRRFAAGVAQLCNYEIMDENVPSRVVCLKRKS
jgi:tRNA wybutosine-synthesizing protein 1